MHSRCQAHFHQLAADGVWDCPALILSDWRCASTLLQRRGRWTAGAMGSVTSQHTRVRLQELQLYNSCSSSNMSSCSWTTDWCNHSTLQDWCCAECMLYI
jgi:hypothetical protein